MELVNTSLLKNPLNYVVVTLMVLIGGVVVHLIMRHWGNN